MQEKIKNRAKDVDPIAEDMEEEVFKKVFIPRTLNEVVDIEEEIEKGQRGEEELLYQKLTGVKITPEKKQNKEQKELHSTQTQISSNENNPKQITTSEDKETDQIKQSDSSGSSDSNSDEDENESSNEESEENEDKNKDQNNESESKSNTETDKPRKKRILKKNEDKETKKARKIAMKEQKREKRKTKVPKHVKKRRQQLARKSNKANK
jgi:RIO kinase 1